MEFFDSQRGNKMLCYEGYLYTQQRVSKSNFIISWLCRKRIELKCPASARTCKGTFTLVKGHNHATLPEEIAAVKLRGEMRKIAENSDALPGAIFNSVVRTADGAISTLLPSEESCKRTIRNQRRKKLLKQPEDLDSLDKAKKKPSASAAAAKHSQPTFEPDVVINEEPTDIDEPTVPSTSRTDHESTQPCTDSLQSGIPVLPCKDPASSTSRTDQESMTSFPDPVLSTSGTDHEFITSITDLVPSTSGTDHEFITSSTDPVPSTSGTDHEFITSCADSFQSFTTSDEDEVQTNSNFNTKKSGKRKAAEMADAGQSKPPFNEDSVTKKDNGKDQVFQCSIVDSYSLVKSGKIVEQQQVVQKPQWYKTSNGTKMESSKKTLVAEQSLPVEDDSLTTENRSAQSHLDVYGKYIAAELKMLDSKSCAHVQRVIADLLYDAKLGKFK